MPVSNSQGTLEPLVIPYPKSVCQPPFANSISIIPYCPSKSSPGSPAGTLFIVVNERTKAEYFKVLTPLGSFFSLPSINPLKVTSS